MSGEGCRTFKNMSEISWTDLFRLFVTDYAFSVNITRMDLAVDNFEGYSKIPTLIVTVLLLKLVRKSVILCISVLGRTIYKFDFMRKI